MKKEDASIAELIKEIKLGGLLLPEFQRGYVWTNEQVKSYVDSLYRGYPTGHFLIWKTYSPQSARGQGTQSEGPFSRLILDGQQRLTSIYALFEGKAPAFYEGESLYFDLYFDLTQEEFQFFQKAKMTGNPLWISVTPFLQKGINRFLEELNSLPDEQKTLYMAYINKFNRLDSIRNYAYRLDEISEKPIEEIVKVFNLVNSSGTPLKKADLALAKVCSYWPEARETLRHARKYFKNVGFSFDMEFFTRSISSVAVGNIYFEAGFDKATRGEIEEAWNRVFHTLEYAVNILKTDCFIDSTDNLTTPYVLVPLIVYLTRQGGVFKGDSEKRRFIHWMYAALMWGRYSGSMESSLQADLNTLSGDDPVASLVNNILKDRGRIRVEPQDLEGKGTSSPFYTMAYIVARSRSAVDWFTGVQLYSGNLGKSFGLEDHHIFPQSVLYKNGYDANESKDRKKVNEIANRAVLTKKANLKAAANTPSKYLPDVKRKYPQALGAQFVPNDPALWELDHYNEFLSHRRGLLSTGINAFMDSLIAQQNTKQPSSTELVMQLLKNGESEQVEYKSSFRWDYKENKKNKDLESVIVKSVAGFLNAKGGTLLIGVDPNRQILGLENDYKCFSKDPNRDGFEQKLTGVMGAELGKDVTALVTASFIDVEGKDICWVRVEPSFRPVYIEQNGDFKFYVRLGNSTQPMNVKESAEYITHRWGKP